MHRLLPALLPALLAAALLSGCAVTSRPILLEGKPLPADAEGKWEKYGAYLVFDELFVEETMMDAGPGGPTPWGTIVVNKRIKILTREGASAGSVAVPRYSDNLIRWRLAAADSAGKPLALDSGGMLAAYRKHGKLVFPNVGPGCVLDIMLEFRRTDPITVFEHWFSGALPVAQGRFTLSGLSDFRYDVKTYGPARKGLTRMVKPEPRLIYRAYEVSDIAPRARIEYQEEADEAEPRVSAVMRSYHGTPVISDWEGLSRRYEEAAFKPALFNSSRKLDRKVAGLCAGKTGAAAKAEAIFGWVSDSVSLKVSDLGRIDPDKVIASGQGNIWEMAAILKAMFRKAGLGTEVHVTRPRGQGGFDPGFESPIQLVVPLVSVKLDGKDFLAFPFARGGALGEYPDDYFGLSGLALHKGAASPLPPYSGGETYLNSTYRIDPADPEGDQELDLELGGYLAYSARSALFKQAEGEVKEVFQKFLGSLGTSNALVRCEVTGREDRGRPLRAKLVFRNPNQAIERKGETQLRLGNLLQPRLAGIDTARSSGYSNALAYRFTERIEAAKPAGRRLEADLPCAAQSNAIFRSSCAVEDQPGKLVVTREVVLHKAGLNATGMRALYPQIRELNRAREGSLILRGAADAPPAAAAPKPARPRKGP